MGGLLILIGVLMLPAVTISWIYQENSLPILISAAISLFIGLFLFFFIEKQDELIRKREGYLIVTLSWVFMTGFGMLPFILSKEITSFSDALFETVSGLTTTGAKIGRASCRDRVCEAV